MANDPKNAPDSGEGNHEADRRYREDTRRFVEGGGVEKAAREAKRALENDGEELEAAEDAGRSRIAEEDPEVSGGTSRR
jgi:hypothetical protein